MTAVRFNISMQRNEDWVAQLVISDDAGRPIDLTGWELSLQIKERLDNSDLISAASIEIIDAAGGVVTIALRGPGHALGIYGKAIQTYQLPYDLVAIDPSGAAKTLLAGYVILSRGISA